MLYVGKATNLRQRVRSYFSGDDRRKIGPLLRETHDIRHVACATTLEAAVTEVRLIHEHQPRYNRVAKRWRSYAYLKLTLDEAFPRLAVVKATRDDGGLYLGPLPSAASARLVGRGDHDRRAAAALHRSALGRQAAGTRRAVHGRRSSAWPPARAAAASTPSPTAAWSTSPCGVSPPSPPCCSAPLADRMDALAAAERFEEAADVRDRAAALSGALTRQRRVDSLRRAGVVRVAFRRGGGAEVHNGVLVRTWTDDVQATAAAGVGPRAPGRRPTAPARPGRRGRLHRRLARGRGVARAVGAL